MLAAADLVGQRVGDVCEIEGVQVLGSGRTRWTGLETTVSSLTCCHALSLLPASSPRWRS
jgi:hypothetical protein